MRAHGRTQVLAAMRRDEHEARPCGPVENRMGVTLPHCGSQGVDAGVARNPDAVGGLALLEEVAPRGLRGREVPAGHHVDRLAVELLRPGAVEVPGAKARLDVPHGYPQVEARDRRREGRGGVAVNEHRVGLLRLQNRPHLEQHVAGDIEERLAGPHDVEVVVRNHAECVEHLVEHLAVLAGDAHDGLEIVGTRLELVDERTHLDGLRSRAKDEHDLLHD